MAFFRHLLHSNAAYERHNALANGERQWLPSQISEIIFNKKLSCRLPQRNSASPIQAGWTEHHRIADVVQL